MQYWWIILGIVILFFLNKLILAPLRKLFFHIISGLVVLHIVNTYGHILHLVHVPITLVTGLIIGIFGFPGTVLVTLYYTFLH